VKLPLKQRSISTPREVRSGDLFTDPARIKEYHVGAEVQKDRQVGSPITFKGEWEDKSSEDKGEILAFEPERKIAYSQWKSRWTSTRGRPASPCACPDLQGGATDDDRANREEYEKNWKQMLDGLKKTTQR
jgi:hypothetical protein